VTCTPEQQAAGLAALTVTASPVVLDLGGHTVRGTIRVNGSFEEDTDITVRNGTALRISVWNTSRLGVTDLGLTWLDSHYSQVTVSASELDGRGSGRVYYDEGSSLTVTGSTINRTTLEGAAGSATIVRSVLRDTFVAGGVNGRGSGYLAVTDSRLLRSSVHAEGRAVIERNTIRDAPTSADAGVDIDAYYLSAGATVRDNVITGGRVGIQLAGSRSAATQVTGNTVRDAAAAGILVDGYPGPAPSESLTTITGNRLLGNGHHSNGATDSTGRPVDDGLHIVTHPDETPVLVAANRTRDNADYGIEVAAGTVQEGGGNTSRDDPSGCLGVRCG
jgi:hypothetical protein